MSEARDASRITTHAKVRSRGHHFLLSKCPLFIGAPHGALRKIRCSTGVCQTFGPVPLRFTRLFARPRLAAVNSQAAVALTTKAFSEMAKNATIGRAEAMRQSMAELITEGEPYEAHPSYWAPFVVVGEGGVPASAKPAASAKVQSPMPKQKTSSPAKGKAVGDWNVEVFKP